MPSTPITAILKLLRFLVSVNYSALLVYCTLSNIGQYSGSKQPLPEYHVKIAGFDEKVHFHVHGPMVSSHLDAHILVCVPYMHTACRYG